jgi:hypothetical protein
VLLLVLNQLGSAHPTSEAARSVIVAVQVLGVFLVAAVGWLVATAIWPPPRPQPGSLALGAQ